MSSIRVVEITDIGIGQAAPAATINQAAAPRLGFRQLPTLTGVGAELWRDLADRALESNGYYLPDWELVNASARARQPIRALCAWSRSAPPSWPRRLIGLMPVQSAWNAYRLPIAALACADPFGTLRTPLLDTHAAIEAAGQLVRAAREAGAGALILQDVTVNGPVLNAFRKALSSESLAPIVLESRMRACLDATQDPDALLREALGAKKLKELARQRRRLAEHGDVRFAVATSPADVARGSEIFLALEQSGWKGTAGTAMAQAKGDAVLARIGTVALAAHGQCEIVSLWSGETPVAAAIVLRHKDRAFFFKIGIDERFAKYSPGVQLTLELTRHLCNDPAIRSADSTASSKHPMIDPIWRDRFVLGTVFIPLRRGVAVTAAYRLTRARFAARKIVQDTLRRIRRR